MWTNKNVEKKIFDLIQANTAGCSITISRILCFKTTAYILYIYVFYDLCSILFLAACIDFCGHSAKEAITTKLTYYDLYKVYMNNVLANIC